MNRPDQRIFEADLQDAEFQIGVAKGMWNIAVPDQIPPELVWPKVVFWVAAARRNGAPDGFYVIFDCDKYRSVSPTGTFWDPDKKLMLALDKRPKGKPNSRVAKVFRTDWENGEAFYHPYDRRTSTHADWSTQHPHLVWTSNNTIADFLAEIHALLNSEDYIGV